MKLKNGSDPSEKKFFLPIWMIRTGMSANPLHVDASSLVASGIATLFDLSDDMKALKVAYPSDSQESSLSRLNISLETGNRPLSTCLTSYA